MGQSTSEQEGEGHSQEVGFDYSIYLYMCPCSSGWAVFHNPNVETGFKVINISHSNLPVENGVLVTCIST